MLIDWFTVLAQVINFLVLVWLLKRFLYQPILDAIDAREKRIAAKLADADEKEIEAEQQRDEFRHKNTAFDKEKSDRMIQVKAEVKAERTRLLEAARVESEDLRGKLQSALKNEQLSLEESLSSRVREEVFEIARKTLSDLAGITLEARMTEVFIDRLRALNDEDKVNLKSALLPSERAPKESKQPLIIRSAFALPDEQRASIESIVREIIGGDDPIQFVTESALVSGIEINANGQKMAWSIGDYLASLSKSVDQLLQTLAKKEQAGDKPAEEGADESADKNAEESVEENAEKSSKKGAEQITEQVSHENST